MIESFIRLACLLEASARKVGNVHPAASFETLTYEDFIRSAQAAAPALANAADDGVGRAILHAVRATRVVTQHNTNLGIILLLAPLAVAAQHGDPRTHVASVLQSLTIEDSAAVFEAIRIAQPRGLGAAPREDVARAPTQPLVEIMSLAADRDSIAAQYTTNFRLVLDHGVPIIASYGPRFATEWERAIVELQLRLMALQPDTDIARKCGVATAIESAQRAAQVLDGDWWETAAGRSSLANFDRWLRADGSQRNPGTTADLVTASLFVALQTQSVVPPTEAEVERHAESLRFCQTSTT